MNDQAEKLCEVCGAVSEGMHFGVETCRACAAFFRRSISLKRKYVCRTGTNNCKLANAARNACRKCRLKRCFQIGMLKDNVQPNRDPLRNCERSLQYFSLNSGSACGAKNDEKTRLITDQLLKPLCNKLDPVNCSTPTEYIITLIEAGYEKFCQARLDMELSRVYKTSECVQKAPDGYPKELKLCTFQELMKLHHNAKILSAQFLRDTFECYNVLPIEQKWCLFRNFFESLGSIELHFLTKSYFPDRLSRRVATSFCTYADLEQLPHFFGSFYNEPFAKLVEVVMNEELELIDSLRSFTVDRYELAALVALLLFSEGSYKLEDETKKMISKMREKIFFGLHYYYTEVLKVKDYAYRVGESVSLLWLIKKCGYKHKNATETAELFGAYNVNDILYGDFAPELL